MKYRYLFIIALLSFFQAESQTLSDVLRYSFHNPSGSARYLGVGGAMSALGADYAAISSNPAGLGAYWTSEFVLSPGILSYSTDSELQGIISEGRSYSSLKFDNFGIIISNKPKKGALKAFNTAIGLNRIADFNDNFYFSGRTMGSITERFAQRANGRSVDDLDLFEADLAYATGAIYAPDENNTYTTDFIDSDIVSKSQDVDQSGGINELVFSMGANISNRLLFGASFGVPFLNFESRKLYQESDPDDLIPAFNSLEYSEYLNTSGIGYNVKAGVIIKVTKDLSLSGSIHSPTYYNLTDNYSAQMEYSYFEETNQRLEESSPDGSFRYKLQTPWKANGGVAFKKMVGDVGGFLSGEIEYVDYRNGQLNLSAFSTSATDQILESDINNQVQSQLLAAINLRLGGEFAYKKFRVRGGYGMIGSPYGADEGVFFPNYSFGVGWREDKFYLDLGYRTSRINEGYIPYMVLDDERLQVVENTIRRNKLVVTLGFQF